MDTKIILSTPPEHLSKAADYGKTLAHMAYQVGTDFHLYRAGIPLGLKGGLMVLGDSDWNGEGGDTQQLTGEIIKECIYRGYEGVLLDFQGAAPQLHALTAVLSSRLQRQGGDLYVYEAYAGDTDWGRVLISTAISGGSLSARLQEVAGLFGKERIALDIERIRVDFCLPSSQGQGRQLDAKELYTLTRTYHPQPYFSQELCAYYFTFKDKDGSHFVLYDDAGSIRKKMQLAARVGIGAALLLYPEVEDILEAGLL